MSILQRLSLAGLLILFLAGAAGHAMLTPGGSHHLLSESVCAFHHGMNVPESLQMSTSASGISPGPIPDTTRALDLAFQIPHPPTF